MFFFPDKQGDLYVGNSMFSKVLTFHFLVTDTQHTKLSDASSSYLILWDSKTAKQATSVNPASPKQHQTLNKANLTSLKLPDNKVELA